MLDVKQLRESFALLAPNAEALIEGFYALLFERYPAVKPLFAETSPKKQRQKLIGSLITIVENLEDLDKLVPYLQRLGGRHVGYGTQPAHYEAVASCLLDAMAEMAGPEVWTQELATCWSDALQLVATVMLQGAAEVQKSDKAA